MSCNRSISGATAHLFVKTLQLHLKGLQEALPLSQLPLGSPQSLVALLHLILHRFQLKQRERNHFICGTFVCLHTGYIGHNCDILINAVMRVTYFSPHLLAVPLLSLLLVLLDNPLILGAQLRQDAAQLWPSS